MHNFKLAFEDGRQVLWVGLILGAGLPAVFALGIRSLAIGTSGTAVEGHEAGEASALGKALAGVCFAIVLLAVAAGILLVVAGGLGKEVSFAHVFPVLRDKK